MIFKKGKPFFFCFSISLLLTSCSSTCYNKYNYKNMWVVIFLNSKNVDSGFRVLLGAILLIGSILLLIFALGEASNSGFFIHMQNIISTVSMFMADFTKLITGAGSSILLFLAYVVLHVYKVFLLVLIIVFINFRLEENVVARVFKSADEDGRHEKCLKFNSRDFFTLSERFVYFSSLILLFASIVITFNTSLQALNVFDVIDGSNANSMDSAVFSIITLCLACALDAHMIYFGFLACRFREEEHCRK